MYIQLLSMVKIDVSSFSGAATEVRPRPRGLFFPPFLRAQGSTYLGINNETLVQIFVFSKTHTQD
jgi:hypothetical protein